MLIIGGSRSRKTNELFHLIIRQQSFDKKYLQSKDSCGAKYQLLINKSENVGLKHFDNSKNFIEYSKDMDNIYENIDEINPNKKLKILIVFDLY